MGRTQVLSILAVLLLIPNSGCFFRAANEPDLLQALDELLEAFDPSRCEDDPFYFVSTGTCTNGRLFLGEGNGFSVFYRTYREETGEYISQTGFGDVGLPFDFLHRYLTDVLFCPGFTETEVVIDCMGLADMP